MRSEGLTSEQYEVVRDLVDGRSRQQIRYRLELTASGLDALIRDIYRKTGTDSEAALIEWASR